MSAGRDTEDRNARFISTDSAGTDDEDVQSVSSAGISAGGVSRDEHRDMLLASLLEDHYRTLAAELINTASPGNHYTRSSPEVQVLGQHLYREASQKLSSGRLLPAVATAQDASHVRQQYMSALDNLIPNSPAANVPSLASTTSLPSGLMNQLRGLAIRPSANQFSLLPLLSNDMQIAQPQPPGQRKSHYRSSFQEVTLLGKGGFGKVYECFSPLDQSTYAVKRIALSEKLWKTFCEGKHDKLRHILREAQALAKLDHPNVVRYHQAWFDELEQFPPMQGPQRTFHLSRPTSEQGDGTPGSHPSLGLPGGGRLNTCTLPLTSQPGAGQATRPLKLLDNRPFGERSDGDQNWTDCDADDSAGFTDSVATSEIVSEAVESASCGIVFGEDTPSLGGAAGPLQPRQEPDWSEQSQSGMGSMSASNDSDIFTDDRSHSRAPIQPRDSFEASAHTLCIQMSLYPMTLAHYLSRSPSRNGKPRHCFHLVPTLRLLLAILAGLRYIHSKGMVHRDIKPGNIFLSAPEMEGSGGYCDVTCRACPDTEAARWLNPRIGDFGLVTQLAHGEIPLQISEEPSDKAEASPLSKDVGTALYRPPRWDDRGNKGVELDIFALGVVFVEMLCPFDTVMERVNALSGLQRGEVPDLADHLVKQGYGTDSALVEGTVKLAKNMANPNPQERLCARGVGDAINNLLLLCERQE